MNLAELTVMRKVLKQKLVELDAITPSCNNCIYYEGRMCQKHGATPPDEWVKGPVECQDWSYDNVPF